MNLGEELAAPAGSGEPASLGPLAWEDPEESPWAGFWRTLREALFHPRRLFQAPGERWQEPLAFGLITGTAGLVAALYWQLLLSLVISRMGDGAGSGAFLIFPLSMKFVLAFMVLTPVMTLANLGLNALCLWGAASLTGCRPAFTSIWRITGYAQAGMAAALVPLLGGLAAGVWVLYLTYKGLKTVFGLSRGRAWGTLLLFLLLEMTAVLVLTGCLLGFLGLMWLMLLRGLT
jgi:hypothetical protein